MNIQKIIGEHGAMPQLCNNAACPAAILTEEGDVFVQGYLPDKEQSRSLSAPAGEGFVRMSKETFSKIVEQL
jgi:hypothetical protein